MFNIYEDIIQRVGHEDQDNYEGLRNDTSQVSWLSTPRVNESINHIITVNPGSDGQNRFYEVDLHSQSSGSTVYTRPTPRCKEQSSAVTVTAETVKHSAQSAPIKIHYIVTEIIFITLILILISHISCIKNIRRHTGNNMTSDILKSDNDLLQL